MRISTYARVTNPKYADFAFDWADIAKSLGTKAGNAFNTVKGALPTTASGAAKLGAGIGAGVGGLNYLGSDDKSIGNLATSVAGGAAIGGAVGYGGASLKNAYQARRAGQTGLQGGSINAPQLAPAASTMPQPEAPVPTSNSQPIQTNAPASQPQLPAAQAVSRPQPTSNGIITTPPPTTSGDTVISSGNQSGNSAPQPKPEKNVTYSGAVEREDSRLVGKNKGDKPDPRVPVEKDGKVQGVRTQKELANTIRNQQSYLTTHNVTDPSQLDAASKKFYMELRRNTSPFANFKVRRYNGFIY